MTAMDKQFLGDQLQGTVIGVSVVNGVPGVSVSCTLDMDLAIVKLK